MKKSEITSLRQEILDISQALESLQSISDKKGRGIILKKIEADLQKIKTKLPPEENVSYSIQQLYKEYNELVENYQSLLSGRNETGIIKNGQNGANVYMQDLNFDEEVNRVEKEQIKEANKLTKELIMRQEFINEQLSADSKNLDQAVIYSDMQSSKSKSLVNNLAVASGEERKTREMNSQIGGRISNKVMGNRMENKIAGYISGWISNLIQKKHQKKLEEVKNM